MNDDEFEWDDAKAAQNYAKHGVTFEAARDVFKDPFAIEQIDDRHDYGKNAGRFLARRAAVCIRGLHDKERQHSHHFGSGSGALRTTRVL